MTTKPEDLALPYFVSSFDIDAQWSLDETPAHGFGSHDSEGTAGSSLSPDSESNLGRTPSESSDMDSRLDGIPEPARPVKRPRELLPKPPRKNRKRRRQLKDESPSVISKRRAQNRASQRAYRERKDQRIRDLEMQVEDGRKRYEELSRAYMALSMEFSGLTSLPFEAACPGSEGIADSAHPA